MRVTTKRIEFEWGETFQFKPIADIHIGNKAFDKKAFKEYLADSGERTYFIGIGDLYDSIVVNDIRYQKSIDDSDSDDILDSQIETAIELLEPYKDRIIGLGVGNHEQTVIKRCGTDLIKRTCRRLGVENLGFSGLVRLIFGQTTKSGRGAGRTVIVRYHHGHGGGSRTIGADLTKYSKDMAYWDADIFLYGHVHRLQFDQQPRLGLVGDKLLAKPKHICICGTFLKTYLNSTDATYSEVKGYPPVSVGGLNVFIKPKREWVKIWVQ